MASKDGNGMVLLCTLLLAGLTLWLIRLFIVDGIISLPVALLGYLVLPDLPEIAKPFYLSKEVSVPFLYLPIRRSWRNFIRRLHSPRREWNWRDEKEGNHIRKRSSRKYLPLGISTCWPCSTCKAVLQLSYLTLLIHCSTFNNSGLNAAPVFAQYLKASKSPKYTVAQINTYPTITSAVQVITTLIYACKFFVHRTNRRESWYSTGTSDSVFKGRRWPPIIFGGAINIMVCISLAIWEIPAGWKWTCFILAGCVGGLSGLCMR